jgi:hypothetical protein
VSADRFAALAVSRTAVTGNVTTQAGLGLGGGGLFVRGPGGASLVPASISGCTVSNNTTPADGGGALVTGGVRLTVAASTFAGDAASGSGGGLCTTGTGANQVPVSVAGCRFADDRATNSGGGILFLGDGPVSVRSTRVAGCASGTGGGIYADSIGAADGFVMAGCTLAGNRATSGGGLAVIGVPTFSVSGSSFADNWASQLGGGVYVDNADGSILGTRVAGNAAALDGGGVYHGTTGTVVLEAALVRANTAPTGPDVYGTFTFV